MRLLERHWAEHPNAFSQIHFLFTPAFSFAVKQEVVLQQQTENAFHEQAAPLSAWPLAGNWFTQTLVEMGPWTDRNVFHPVTVQPVSVRSHYLNGTFITEELHSADHKSQLLNMVM